MVFTVHPAKTFPPHSQSEPLVKNESVFSTGPRQWPSANWVKQIRVMGWRKAHGFPTHATDGWIPGPLRNEFHIWSPLPSICVCICALLALLDQGPANGENIHKVGQRNIFSNKMCSLVTLRTGPFRKFMVRTAGTGRRVEREMQALQDLHQTSYVPFFSCYCDPIYLPRDVCVVVCRRRDYPFPHRSCHCVFGVKRFYLAFNLVARSPSSLPYHQSTQVPGEHSSP